MARFHGTSVDYHLSLGETESARIFFTVHVEPGTQIPEIPYEALEAEVEQLARTWEDDLLDHLVEVFGPERGPVLAAEYGPRFPDYYKVVETDWEQVGVDVTMLERLRTAVDGFVIGISQRGDRRAPHAGQALQDRRQGRPVRVHAAPRVARSAGRRRGAHRRPGRGQGLHPRLRRARRARRRAEPRGGVRPGARGAHRDVAWGDRGRLAEPPRDLLGTVVAPGADPACLPQVPACACRPASPRSTATTRSRRTPTCRGSSWSCSRRSSTRSGTPRPRRSRNAGSGSGMACRTCPRSTRTRSSARSSARSSRPCERTPTSRTARRCRSRSARRTCPRCRSRSRCSRSSCTRRRWRRSTCGAVWLRAAGSAGRTARRTTAPRSSG